MYVVWIKVTKNILLIYIIDYFLNEYKGSNHYRELYKKQYYLQRKKKEKKNVGIEINKNSHNSNTKRKTLEESEKILKSIPLSLASGHDSYSLHSLKVCQALLVFASYANLIMWMLRPKIIKYQTCNSLLAKLIYQN